MESTPASTCSNRDMPTMRSPSPSVSDSTANQTTTLTFTPISSRKRRSPEPPEREYTGTSSESLDTIVAAKKRRLSLPRPDLRLFTPPSSPPSAPVVRTIPLKLQIPQQEITNDDLRKLKIRRAAAERWKPKLQRAFPTSSEIKDAYKYKLLRHYNDTLALTNPTMTNFTKPHIDRSPRVDNLLKRFPLLSTSLEAPIAAVYKHGFPVSARAHTEAEWENILTHKELLKVNKKITRSTDAQKLAWTNFSSQEEDRIDRGREAMLQSGLWDDDLAKEGVGLPNELPEWRKVKTGIFAKLEREDARRLVAEGHAAKA
ncbi:hypothetical protein EJ02DRAFT_390670 [Clathrospora elynae]|uniref:Uncharacterized protein n=1 Tax=Clathrospora elynae TaxID=706981 RepID=A0A6A5T620_9PLEO|nr:hypothetical protein EJ02DRAFT_390670 [Clathrospora elynae]